MYEKTSYFRNFIEGHVRDYLRWSKCFYAFQMLINYKNEVSRIAAIEIHSLSVKMIALEANYLYTPGL